MAIDDASKRASVLHAGSFFPGRVPQSKDRDAGDLDDANQRGFVLWHYAGISAGAVVAAVSVRMRIGAHRILGGRGKIR
ncbi:hypothetical protein LCGC14_1065120, partial [marine sediment metagenome]